MAGRVRVLSERLMVAGKEAQVADVMDRVVARVRKQPGFVSGDVLKDTADPAVYAILTEWESMPHLNAWLKHADYDKLNREMNNSLGSPVRYQILERQKDEVFLL